MGSKVPAHTEEQAAGHVLSLQELSCGDSFIGGFPSFLHLLHKKIPTWTGSFFVTVSGRQGSPGPYDSPECALSLRYPDSWYRDITSNKKFFSLAATYRGAIVGMIVAEIKNRTKIHKEVCLCSKGLACDG